MLWGLDIFLKKYQEIIQFVLNGKNFYIPLGEIIVLINNFLLGWSFFLNYNFKKANTTVI